MDSPNRVTLVSGASLGLGREVAQLLAVLGHGLVITSRRPDLLAKAAAGLSRITPTVALAGDGAPAAARIRRGTQTRRTDDAHRRVKPWRNRNGEVVSHEPKNGS